MDAIKEAGWTRFKPVEGQQIAELDMKCSKWWTWIKVGQYLSW